MKIIVSFVLLFSTLYLSSQECKDVIYPMTGGMVITECCIKKVKYENLVSYVKDNSSHLVAATKIVKDGDTIHLIPVYQSHDTTSNRSEGLYQGFNHEYYQAKYIRAKKHRNTGIVFTALGLGLGLFGIANASYENPGTSQVALLGGWVFFNVGIPLWISGEIKTNNNKNAMSKSQNFGSGDHQKISLGITKNGISLVLNI